MRFEEKERKYTPPKQGYHRHVIEVVDGPEWTEGRNRKVIHRITKLSVIVMDDGAREYHVFEQRIRQDGTPYNEPARKVWLPTFQGVTPRPDAEAAQKVLQAFRWDEGGLDL